jgi:small neutral amino acid transporter SnatA (MarC family)
MTSMDTLSATLLLLTIMDPLGNVATFVSGLRPVPQERRLRVIARELVIALVILIVFLFAGPWLLGLLHLKQEALFISGGIVLFLIALKMIFPRSRHEGDELQVELESDAYSKARFFGGLRERVTPTAPPTFSHFSFVGELAKTDPETIFKESLFQKRAPWSFSTS